MIMAEGGTAEPVAVFAVSDDADEDMWAAATWHAEFAAREAATSAGAAEHELTRSFEGCVVVITAADGRRFEAWVVADSAVSRYSHGERVDPSRYARPVVRQSS
jgi:hypothetical protein